MTASKLLRQTIDIIKVKDQELAVALNKWAPRLLHSVYTLHKRTKQDTFDILQEFLVRISQASYDYKRELFRIKNKLYEISERTGQYVKLTRKTSLKSTKNNPAFIWTSYKYLIPIRKASLSSLLYRVIHQTYCDAFQSFYTKRNGFVTDGKQRKKVKVRSKKLTGYRTKEVRKIRCAKKEVSLYSKLKGTDIELLDMLSDNSVKTDTLIINKNFFETMYDSVSQPTQKFLTMLIDEDKITSAVLRKTLNMKKRQIDYVKVSALQAWNKANQLQPLSFNKQPIFMQPEQLC